MGPLIEWILKRPGALIPVFFLLACIPSFSQWLPPDGQSAGIAGCYTSLSGITSIEGNQAGMGWNEHPILALEYVMPFTVKELGYSSLSAVFPASHGSMGGKLISGGMQGYRDHSIWISYGLKIGSQCTAGIGIHTNVISTSGRFFHRIRSGCTGGIQLRISERFMIGGQVRYPVQYNSSGSPYSKLKSAVSLGASLEIHQGSYMHADMFLTEFNSYAFSAGFHSDIRDRLRFLAGFKTSPPGFTAGSGFRISGFELLFVSQLHLHYGISSFFSLSYGI